MITYSFEFKDGRSCTFPVDLERAHRPRANAGVPSPWTRLDFHQCGNCPLQASRHPHCPAAVDVEEIALTFRDVPSFERAWVRVQTPERAYCKECDVQTGLRSLLGLIMASSACPILRQLEGLARYHLPFASLAETVFRTTGAYLLRQYFVFQAGGTPDLELRGLHALYAQLHTVNRCFQTRLAHASHQDANLNAIGSLLHLAMGVSLSLEEQVEELRCVFGPPAEGGPSVARGVGAKAT